MTRRDQIAISISLCECECNAFCETYDRKMVHKYVYLNIPSWSVIFHDAGK